MTFANPYIPDINNILSQHQRGLQTGSVMREQNVLSQAGQLMAQGNQTGARNALYEGGQMERGMQIDDRIRAAAQQADAAKLAKAQRSNEILGNLAMAADTPEKWAMAIETAKRGGLNVEQWQDYGTRDYVLAQAGKVKDVLDMELKQRKASAEGFKVVGKGGRIFDEQTRQFIDQPGGGVEPPTFENVSSLRKEYGSQTNIKMYDDAIGVYNSMLTSATSDTAASDLDLVYGLAKVMDPGSVVREGEFETVRKSQAIPEQIKGYWRFLLEGKGKLPPQARKEMLGVARNRLSAFRGEALKATDRFRGLSQQQGIDPSLVVRDIPEVPEFNLPPKQNLDDAKKQYMQKFGLE
jgi:hypothetical protein